MQYKIQVNDFAREGNYVKGLATVTFDNAIKVTRIKIGVGKEDMLFIGMPNYRSKDEEFKDICHPVEKEFRAELYQHIFDTFDSLHDGMGNSLIFNADSKEKLSPAVRVTPIEDGRNGVKGLATVVLNEKFALNNISVKEIDGKMFVDFPSYRTNRVNENNKRVYQNYFYPVTKEWQEKLKSMILDAYQKALDKEKGLPEQGKEKKEGKDKNTDQKKPEPKKKGVKGKSIA